MSLPGWPFAATRVEHASRPRPKMIGILMFASILRRVHGPFLALTLLTSVGTWAVYRLNFSTSKAPRTSAEGLAALKAGNDRYLRGSRLFAHLDSRRLRETVTAQHPFATILSCSDSRAPVEHLFDAGIGDLFVVRVAGNVCSDDEEGSIEYAVEHLKTPLIVILGHSRCGAVTAVVEHAKIDGHIHHLSDRIEPAYEQAVKAFPDAGHDRILDETIRQNVRNGITNLKTACPEVQSRIETGEVQIVGAVYDIKTGRVEWLDDASR